METINISKADARKAYQRAQSGANLSTVLEDLLGKENIKPLDITERVKSYDDGCAALGIQQLALSEFISEGFFTPLQRKNRDRTYARHQQDVICEALNEGWEPDRANINEKKWVVWIEHTGSGFRFSRTDYVIQGSPVGSRLLFKEERLAKYFFDQFQDIHKRAL